MAPKLPKQSTCSCLVEALYSLPLLPELYCWGCMGTRVNICVYAFEGAPPPPKKKIPACLYVHNIFSFNGDCWLGISFYECITNDLMLAISFQL